MTTPPTVDEAVDRILEWVHTQVNVAVAVDSTFARGSAAGHLNSAAILFGATMPMSSDAFIADVLAQLDGRKISDVTAEEFRVRARAKLADLRRTDPVGQ